MVRRWVIRIGAGALVIAAVAACTAAGFVWGYLTVRAEGQKMAADIGKIVSPNGIDEAGYMTIGGVRQWVTVRGQDKSLPILLYLHGGPNGPTSDISYTFQRPYEEYFTVVQWDQRGFGRSNVDTGKLKGTVSNDQLLSDAIDLIEQLKLRLHQPKVIVLGQSWGTFLGIEIAHRRPDLLYAFASIGQLTSWQGNFNETRRLLIELAHQTGDQALLRKMTEAGPYPEDYDGINKWGASVGQEMVNRGHSWHNAHSNYASRLITAFELSPSVSNRDLLKMLRPDPNQAAYIMQVIRSVYDKDVEKEIGTRLEVPWVAMQGDWDWQTPTTLARAYFDKVCAPWKMWMPFHNSAHVVVGEEPGKVLVTLVNDVLPAVTGKVPPGAETCSR